MKMKGILKEGNWIVMVKWCWHFSIERDALKIGLAISKARSMDLANVIFFFLRLPAKIGHGLKIWRALLMQLAL